MSDLSLLYDRSDLLGVTQKLLIHYNGYYLIAAIATEIFM